MRAFKRNIEAVSPVMGIILMVAITILLASSIATLAFGSGGSLSTRPMATIVAANNPDTSSADMKILHKDGDTLKAGEWKISVVLSGNAPVYWTSNSSSGAITVGTQISVIGTTDGAGAWASNTTLISNNVLVSGKKYDVKLVHIPSNTLLVDQVVEVR